ncbi:MAG: hypothetical protein HQ472_00415, partial [Ignavibacteria bacterium]|nr:hypothetical protein [Ignavibacteria bacterium]
MLVFSSPNFSADSNTALSKSTRVITQGIHISPTPTNRLMLLNIGFMLLFMSFLMVSSYGELYAAEPMDTVAKLDPREVWKSDPIFTELHETEPEDFALSPDHQFLFVGTMATTHFLSCDCSPDIVIRRASNGDTVRTLSLLTYAEKCSSYQNNIQVIDPLNRIILSTC